MILSPISFKSTSELFAFLQMVQTSDLMNANNGNIYRAKEVREYLDATSEEKLRDSQLKFGIDRTMYDLIQLKKMDQSDFDELTHCPMRNWEYILYGKNTSSSYSDEPLPPLSTLDEIKEAKKKYHNESLNELIKRNANALSTIEDYFFNVERLNSLSNNTAIYLPSSIRMKPVNGISIMTRDFLKITLTQEAKLKRHLLIERAKSKTEEEVAELNQWIKDIDDNNTKIKQLFKDTVMCLRKNQDLIHLIKSSHSEQMRNGQTKEANEQKISGLDVEKATLSKLIKKREAFLDKVKGIAIIIVIVAPGLLLLSAVIASFIFLTSPLVIIIGLTILLSLTVFPLIIMLPPVMNAFLSVLKRLGDAIDSLAEGKNEKQQGRLVQIDGEIRILQVKNLVLQFYEKEKLNDIKENIHEFLIQELEECIQQIETIEDKPETMLIPQEAPSLATIERVFPPVGPVSMFRRSSINDSTEEDGVLCTASASPQ